MNYRTDLKYDKGQVVANDNGNADSRKKLPEVTLSDHLQSDAWGDSILKNLAKFEQDTNPAINSAVNTHKQMVQTAQNFVKRRAKQDPSVTQYTYLKKMKQDYDSALVAHEKAVKRAEADLVDTRVNAEATFRDKLGFTDRHADEIRQRIYNLDVGERLEVINQAVQNGDGNLLSAVLDAHPMLTGLNKEQQSAFRTMAMTKHTPELKALDDQATKLLSIVKGSYRNLTDVADSMTGKAILDDYQREVEAANSL